MPKRPRGQSAHYRQCSGGMVWNQGSAVRELLGETLSVKQQLACYIASQNGDRNETVPCRTVVAAIGQENFMLQPHNGIFILSWCQSFFATGHCFDCFFKK